MPGMPRSTGATSGSLADRDSVSITVTRCRSSHGSVERHRKDAEARITAARAKPAGGRFLVAGEEFERCGSGQARRVYVTEVAVGSRRNLTHEEEAAFWSWATVEVLRHTGIRIEEMLELTHHSFIAYTLPTTGEVVPMLQVAPSKTDSERLLLVSRSWRRC